MPQDQAPKAHTRVLVLAPEPVYEDRGTPIAVRHVLRALSELDCQVDIITYPVGINVDIPRVRWLRAKNPLGFRRVPVGLSFRKLFLDGMMAVPSLMAVRRSSYDFVHAVEESAFWAALICKRRGIPFLYDMQSSIPQQLSRHPVFGRRLSQAILGRWERWLLSRADLVVASLGLGEYVRERSPGVRVEEWHYPGLRVAPDAVRMAELKGEMRLPKDARAIVYCGTFEEYQGLLAFVGAAKRVADLFPEAVFIAVGGTPRDAEALRETVEGEGLADCFRVLERRPRVDARAIIGLAEVVVSTRAHGDNLPLKIIDYMAARKPIVATDIPAHRSVLDETRAILTPIDASGVAEGIVSLLRDPDGARRLAKAASAYGEEYLAWSAFVRSVRGYKDALIAGGMGSEDAEGAP